MKIVITLMLTWLFLTIATAFDHDWFAFLICLNNFLLMLWIRELKKQIGIEKRKRI
jgi:asparagine N-glycosylation enzyme membrane subunit Stt3